MSLDPKMHSEDDNTLLLRFPTANTNVSMPILAPLADFAGVGRNLAVTAFQSANRLVNFINPTFAAVIGGLAIGRVSYNRWLVFIWPLMLILIVFIFAAISIAALL